MFTSFTDSGGEFNRMGPMEEKPLFQVPQDYPLHITLPDCRLASLQFFQQPHLLYLFTLLSEKFHFKDVNCLLVLLSLLYGFRLREQGYHQHLSFKS